MVDTKLENVRKTFNDGQVVAVDDIDLHVEEGELIVLVGPSGCGKSTTLRCIAGLETPNAGTITFGDHDVTKLPPKDRAVSMVFQNYALYPSMTVYENMSFGLKMRGIERETVNEQVLWAADIMEISDLLDRYPNQLSGGQQQRVALGRAIVRDPALFLLDEPLSNLDAKLRAIMRTEIQELQQELGVATVFVTHDQEEAMTMGDRIAVMNAGRIEQIDDPETVYHDPNSLFVADFIGSPGINFLTCSFEDGHIVHTAFEVDPPRAVTNALQEHLDRDVILGVRPEHLDIVDSGVGIIDVVVEVVEPVGDTKIVYFDLGGKRINMTVPTTQNVEEGDYIGVTLEWPNVHFFSPDGSKVIKWTHATDEAPEVVRASSARADGGLARGEE